MKDRKEPTISPLSADASDAPQSARSPERSTARARPAPPGPVSSRPVIVRSPLGGIALVTALVALGVCGFIGWQHRLVQHELGISASRLDSANQRLAELEKRLALSDDESSQSLTAVSSQVKENVIEIRKLWGVSYDTNRKTIAELEKQFTKLDASLTKLDGSTEQALEDLTGELKVLADLVQAQQSVIGRSEQWGSEQKNALEAISSKLSALESSLGERVKNNEEAIKAIDAFRLQVNRELLKLRGG